MRKILKVTSVMSVATSIRIFSGLVRAKFLAWQLGPTGMGLIGQAQMYSAFTTQLCSLNMQMGITKGVSEKLAEKRGEQVSLIVNTAATLQFLMSILFILAVLPFSGALTMFVFSDSKYWIYFVGITLVTPFAIYMTGVADPILYGFRKIVDCAKLMILYTLVGLLLVFTLVRFYKIEGMLAQILIMAMAAFFMSYYFIKKKVSLSPALNFRIFRDKASRLVMSDLFKYSLISFIPANINMLVILYLRSLFMKQYGVEANGMYQVAYAISAYYLPFVTNGLWGHFYPDMCSLRKNADINTALNQFVRFALFVSTAIAFGAVIFRKYVIIVLFSSKFMKAYDLLAIQASGDIFFILFCMFSTSLMARKKFAGVVSISTIGYNAVLISAYFLLARSSLFDFRSLNIAIALTNVILVITYMVHSNNETGFLLSARNTSLFIKSAVFLAIIFILPDRCFLDTIIKMALAAIWLTLSVTKDEVKIVADIAVSRFKGKFNPTIKG